MNWRRALTIFLVWRSGLFIIGSLANNFLLYKPSFPYFDIILADYDLPRWLYSWANFDGVHYITIAKNGYLGTGLVQAFFPLYPFAMRLLGIFINLPLSGLIISSISLVGILFVWYELIKIYFDKNIAWLSLLLLLVFPTSFYLGAIYSESLFLFLVLATFLAAKNKLWIITAICIGLASASRIVGIFLLPAIYLEIFIQYLEQRKVAPNWQVIRLSVMPFLKTNWKKLIVVAGGSLGLILYMIYLYLDFGDPLYFFHIQAEFGAGRQEKIVLFPQVVWRYIKIIITYQPHDLKFYSFIQELGLSLAGLVILLFGIFKIRWSFMLFALLAFFLPSLTGTLSSMPRYMLVCFPLFIIMAQFLSTRRNLKYFWVGTSTFWLVFNTILFIQGYWVA